LAYGRDIWKVLLGAAAALLGFAGGYALAKASLRSASAVRATT